MSNTMLTFKFFLIMENFRSFKKCFSDVQNISSQKTKFNIIIYFG